MSSPDEEPQLTWTNEARELLDQIPIAARAMVQRAIETSAKGKGFNEVDTETAQSIIDQFGPPKEESTSETVPSARFAELVIFTKIKRFAPDFHRHILKSKIENQVVKKGDKILVYEVSETVPADEPVKVTESTRLEFR
ncbi:MAG TPA: hypothetical protein VKM55_20310 [Candidatus Lokiarchaeia archaeon]|nr:hypothetical protein [Candidatus Lokiarchaeia archaeon]